VSEAAVKKYVVRLSAEERQTLAALISKGKHPAALVLKARTEGLALIILLFRRKRRYYNINIVVSHMLDYRRKVTTHQITCMCRG
jgi:hypothetical protein